MNDTTVYFNLNYTKLTTSLFSLINHDKLLAVYIFDFIIEPIHKVPQLLKHKLNPLLICQFDLISSIPYPHSLNSLKVNLLMCESSTLHLVSHFNLPSH